MLRCPYNTLADFDAVLDFCEFTHCWLRSPTNPSSLHLISPWAFWGPLPATLTSSCYSAVTTRPLGVSWSCLSLSNCTKLSPSQDTAGYDNVHLIFLGWARPGWVAQAGRILEMKRFLFGADCEDNCQSWKATKPPCLFPALLPYSPFFTCAMTKTQPRTSVHLTAPDPIWTRTPTARPKRSWRRRSYRSSSSPRFLCFRVKTVQAICFSVKDLMRICF